MALSISSAAIIEKNKLQGSSSWIILVKVTFSDGTIIRVSRDNQDTTWDSYTCTAFPFDLDDSREEGQGEHSVLNLRIANVSRVIQAYMEAADGGVGASVDLYVVHSDHLDLTSPEIHETFICTSSHADSQWATFELSAPNQIFVTFPPYRYLKNFCRWGFKGIECGYSGTTPGTYCDKTLPDCRKYGNTQFFGGFPGVPEGAFYVGSDR